ncbi:MAG TPA: UDP-3-O-(3-hydroxymyristoyl)glucosamine N-acyltransferase [Zetaproteobacteria bacterium]|nr:UDP-3-O-(3-hydroxymyristoyl)glucosamine N-acyltransferase [Zetaproteobacteria bacterium]
MTNRALTLGEAARVVSGSLHHAGEDDVVTGVNTLAEADATQVSFLANRKYAKDFAASKAGVILLAGETLPEAARPLIRVKDPYLAFALLQRHFHPDVLASGQRHPSAVIDASARLAPDVDVGAQVVIGANVSIAAGSRIGAACVLEDGAQIGENCLLHSRSTIGADCVLGNRVIIQVGAVIGSDGFGYAWSGREHLKIPQVGRVVLEDDVEIGANTCIDRGAIGDTVIRRGVKLDNLIQIGHNVDIGAFSIMASQVGVSGSTTVGQGCQFGGQVGTAGHIKIGDGCKIAAKSGVAGDLEAGGTYAGIPVMPHKVWLKVSAILPRLPGLWGKLSALGFKS